MIKCQEDEGHWPNSQEDDGAVTELLRCGVDVNGAHLKILKLEIIDCSTPGKSPRPKQIKFSPLRERIPQETFTSRGSYTKLARSCPTKSP